MFVYFFYSQGYEVVLKLNTEQTNIMTFGIYGQYYEKSSAMATKAGNTFIIAFILLTILGFMNLQ